MPTSRFEPCCTWATARYNSVSGTDGSVVVFTSPDIKIVPNDHNGRYDVFLWLNENSVFSALKLMLGRDPKKEYKDKVAEVKLAG